MQLEYKSIPLQLKDIDNEHRIVVFAHATYDNIDRMDDISRKGMFAKSWNEHKSDIGFYINHDPERQPGMVRDVFEDDKHGYTKAEFGKHTLGNDTLEMVDMGIIKDASFGFKAIKYNKLPIKGRSRPVRELKEVYHGESTLVHGLAPINPLSGVKLVRKSAEPYILELKAKLETLEKFVRNAKASDECIIQIADEVKAIQDIISQYDTANTHEIDEPDASDKDEMNEDEMTSNILTSIKLIHAKMSVS